MLRRLNDLYRRIIPNLRSEVCWQRHLRQAPTTLVLLVAGTRDLEDGLHREGVVEWDSALAEVDVEEGGRVAREPAGLGADGAASDRPEGSICRDGHAAAYDSSLVELVYRMEP